MIRAADRGDAAGIGAIWNPVIRDTTITFNPTEKSDDDVRAFLDDKRAAGQGVFVAEHESRIVGFAAWGQFRGGAGYRFAAEHSIVLAEPARGRGLGRALMTAIEDHAQRAGVHTLWAGVSGENPGGVPFHAALGFSEVARLQEVGYKFGRWIDLILMRKQLGPSAPKPV